MKAKRPASIGRSIKGPPATGHHVIETRQTVERRGRYSGSMYPLKKGKFASQAHVGLPEGTYEEEHGRKGFYGKSAHLYHTHPPTDWIRFEGKLRPHCLDLNRLHPCDQDNPEGSPIAFLGNDDVRLY